MGSVRFGAPTQLIDAIQRQTGADTFIETGTFQGDTAEWAAGQFAHVSTIELPGPWYDGSKERLKNLPAVTLHCGDTREIMRQVVAHLTKPAIFWLDAHWMGSGPKGKDCECPVIDEITYINTSVYVHTILVDDARYFCKPPPPPHDPAYWPDLGAVVTHLTAGNRYVYLVDDVIVAVPKLIKDWFVQYLRSLP